MVLYGIGMGLTSAPATEAIMGVVPRAKAGVGSAVNDATRLLGGTLGVAIIGSVYASLYSSRLTEHLPARLPGRRWRRPRTARSAPRSAWPAAWRRRPRRARRRRRPRRLRRVHRRPLDSAAWSPAASRRSGAVMAALLLPAFPSASEEQAEPASARAATALAAAGGK